MANDYKLFKQAATPNSKWQGAPKLVPKSGTTAIVNIHDNYAWTASPKEARADIPQIIFEELALDLSSLVTSALYKLRGSIQNVQSFSSNAADVLSTIGLTDKQSVADISKLNNTATSDALNPYAGMYAATPTGWTYIAPYLQEPNQSVSNNWGSDSNGGNNSMNNMVGDALKGAVKTAASIVDSTNLLNITAPGSYAETPKFYNPSDTGSYTVQFPLINTLKPDDVVNNWELCYLLTYQNLPNRRSINLLDPPVLYRITIPGMRQSPVAYISNLSIKHVGNIRNIDIYGSGLIKPIPEAYMVTIEFKDLLMNSRNLYKYALDDQKVVATISSTPTPPGT